MTKRTGWRSCSASMSDSRKVRRMGVVWMDWLGVCGLLMPFKVPGQDGSGKGFVIRGFGSGLRISYES